MNTLAELQDTLDEHKEALPNGAYVQLCDGLKRLHSLTDLYIVRYCQVDLSNNPRGASRYGTLGGPTGGLCLCFPVYNSVTPLNGPF